MSSGEQKSDGMTWLVVPGLAMIAVTYGLFLPEIRQAFGLSETLLGLIGAGSYVGYCVTIIIALVFTSRTGPRFMAVVAGTVAVVGMAAVASAPSAWVLALGVLAAGSSSGLASPPMGEAVGRSIRRGLQDRANTLINSGTSIGVALSGPAALLLAEQWRLAWAAFAFIGLLVLLWIARVIPHKAVSGGPQDQTEAGGVPRLSVRYLIGARSVLLYVAATGVGFASAAY